MTEAIIDAATLSVVASAKEELLQYAILACYGTNGLTEEHKTAIKQLHKLEEVIFFFDGDKPGREGIKKYQEELIKLLPNVLLSAVDTPENEDVNSLSVAYEPEIFTHLYLIENRVTLSEVEGLSTETVLTELEPIRTTGKLNTKNPEFITFTTETLKSPSLVGSTINN